MSLAESFSLAAKFTGSGGAFLCVRDCALLDLEGKGEDEEDNQYFDEAREEEIRKAFGNINFDFVRIEIPEESDYE